ncbi:MAG: hypothetical protein INH43_10870 [Acidobacteriaceae bacterium]|nr:hypothetical protein [Acidobacteriaceae bacterium]
MRFEYEFGDIADENNDLVAKVEQHQHGLLLAAAPELLAALEIWARYAESNGWTDADHHDGDPATTGWITRTRAAIARAKGRA